MTGSVVVDASVAVKWLIQEENTDIADAALRYWTSRGISRIAPHLLLYEVTNAIHRRVLLGELSLANGSRLIESLATSGVEFRHVPRVHVRAMQIAAGLKQSAAYDAHYLALAELSECELWTADRRFYDATTPHTQAIRWIGDFATPA